MARVVHFELAADDPERAIQFYEKVFGWQIQKWDGPQDYWLATTGERGTPGIDGAIMRRDPNMPAVVNTIDVASLDESLAKLTANGGTVVAPKMTIPGVGYMAYCQDTEGNTFGMMQADPAAA
ncbi:MAG TPA: VOC family protein [Roseiflexaceae bacterium]|nr:VOC family protein [Roseiflexaceae bacterium]